MHFTLWLNGAENTVLVRRLGQALSPMAQRMRMVPEPLLRRQNRALDVPRDPRDQQIVAFDTFQNSCVLYILWWRA